MLASQLFYKKISSRHSKGSAIVETTAGMFVLLPVFLILLDVIALVIGQTINDDIAKKAARYAAQASTASAGRTLADNYMDTISYTGNSGLVTHAQIIGFNWSNTQIQVITQVKINLPVGVPLGGPLSQLMQSQAIEPTVGVPATPIVTSGS